MTKNNYPKGGKPTPKDICSCPTCQCGHGGHEHYSKGKCRNCVCKGFVANAAYYASGCPLHGQPPKPQNKTIWGKEGSTKMKVPLPPPTSQGAPELEETSASKEVEKLKDCAYCGFPLLKSELIDHLDKCRAIKPVLTRLQREARADGLEQMRLRIYALAENHMVDNDTYPNPWTIADKAWREVTDYTTKDNT